MPSSLTRVLSVTFGYSPYLPVSVCGTGTHETRIEVFLGSMLRTSLWANALLITSRGYGIPDLPGVPPYQLEPALPIAGWSFTPASPRSSDVS
jgi:hypothetical protein